MTEKIKNRANQAWRWIVKIYWRLRGLEVAYVIGILTVVASSVLAWVAYSNSFPGDEFIRNTLAGICSLGVGIILVNAVLEERRKKNEEEEWNYARTLVISPILTHIVKMYLAACRAFYQNEEVGNRINHLHTQLLSERKFMDKYYISGAFSDISKEIQASVKLMKDEPEFHQNVFYFYREIEQSTDEILNFYMPESFEVTQNSKVFVALFDFKKVTMEPLKVLKLASDPQLSLPSNEMLTSSTLLIIGSLNFMLPKLLQYLDRKAPFR